MQFILENSYVLSVFVILSVALVLVILEKGVFRRLYPRVKASPRIWDDALVHALHFPVLLYVLLYGIVFSFVLIEETHPFDPIVASLVDHFYQIGAVVLLGWSFLRFIHKYESRLIELRAAKYDRTTVRGVSQVLKVFIFSFVGLGVLQILGIPISAIVAFGGLGGIAVGFAAKDLLANIFGGMIIFLDRQFQIGDWIRSPDQEIEGVVEEIGWRLTKIQTLDKRPLYIPNSVFSTISLENPSRMRNRKIKAQIGLSYTDAPKIAQVLSEIEKVLKSHPDVDLSCDCYANLVDLGPYCLEVSICAYTKTIQTLKFQVIQQDLLLRVLDVLREHNCEVGYPINSLESCSTKRSIQVT